MIEIEDDDAEGPIMDPESLNRGEQPTERKMLKIAEQTILHGLKSSLKLGSHEPIPAS